jgi:hypothetical protein
MRKTIGIAALVAATALPAAAVGAGPSDPAATTAQAAREFEGTVLSVNRANRTFRLRDTQRGTVRIRVTRRTRFERVSGLAGLRRGMTSIEATVRRSGGAWVASEVERSGGGGRHGGDD